MKLYNNLKAKVTFNFAGHKYKQGEKIPPVNRVKANKLIQQGLVIDESKSSKKEEKATEAKTKEDKSESTTKDGGKKS